MSAQDDDAAKGQGKPPIEEVDRLLGQHPLNIEQPGEIKPNTLSAGSEQDQPPLETTNNATTKQQTGDATPPKARKRKSETKESLSKIMRYYLI